MEILKSLFMPLKMRRFRDMPVLMALAIFLVATYLIVIPTKVSYSNTFKVLKTNGYFCNDFYSASTDFDFSVIAEKGYSFTNDKNPLLNANDENLNIATIVATTENGEAYTNYFIFDLSKNEFNNNDNLYDLYYLDKIENSRAILFAKSYYHLQYAQKNSSEEIEVMSVQGSSYRYMNVDFTAITKTDDFLKAVGTSFASLYGDMYVSSFTLICFFMIFALPLVLVTVMWLVLRKGGSLKKFSEYYNIASIASIVPTLIAFIVSWFFPQIVNFYTTVFVMYFLYVIYRINAYRIDEEPDVKAKK